MLWRKICLDGYIPFSHVGNKHVEIEFDKPATCIIGANGSGKSSLLRIMDVLTPPTRPEFAKDGKIEMTLEHDNHLFVMTSDFKNSTSPHSFKRDGVELNLSGTSEVQKDLAIEHFGLTPAINDLMSGNVHICSMPKSQRKQLFSALYPSDLSFILEYHKKVCSQIRAFSNQIKLLQGREGSLVTSLIDENELCRLKNWHATANDIVVRIDKINLLLENEINQLKDHEALKKPYDLSILDSAQEILENIRSSITNRLIDYDHGKIYGEDLSVESLSNREVSLNQEAKFLQSNIDTSRNNLSSIRDELDKFTRIKNMPTSDKRDEISKELDRIKIEMSEIESDPNWTNIPGVQKDKLEYVVELFPRINDLVASLHEFAGILIGQEQITKLRSESDAIRFTLSSLTTEKVGLEHQLQQHKSRKSMLTQNSYPQDCSRVCGLRASLEASVRDIDLRCKDIEARLNDIDEMFKSHNATLSEYQKTLQDVSPAIPIMKSLWDILADNYLTNLALDGESFVDCLNVHGFEIINRLKRGIESSKLYYRYEDLKHRSDSITNTLSMMDANDSVSMSIDVIDDIIRDRKAKLESGITELDDLEKTIEKIRHDIGTVVNMGSSVATLERVVNDISSAMNAVLILERIKFDQQLVSEHNNVRNVVSSKLREIEHTLQEQRRIVDVLNTEIRPTLNELREQRKQWETVEEGLSPTKGLPCIYLIRFMNRIFARANAIISSIWYCDMELAYIDEKEGLDFSIELILNKSSTVKDISLCSNGQKAVVDFAVTVALAIERGFNKWLPFKCDEIDAALTPEHRLKLTQCISDFLDDGTMKQLLLVNHFAIQTGISACDIVSLSEDGLVLPAVYNEHVIIH